MEKNNIIFLDIDGVLNNNCNIKNICDLLGRQQYLKLLNAIGSLPFDNNCCELMKELIKETNSKVVLSSTWRKHQKEIENIEYYTGIKVYDTTPVLNLDRGQEIKQWLENHNDINNYVIIDDGNDMLEEQQNNFIRVDGEVGFNYTNYLKANKILMR